MSSKQNLKQHKKQSVDDSSEHLFEENYETPNENLLFWKQNSQFYTEYFEYLKGVSVKDCLTKHKQELRASKISFNQRCFQSEMSLIILKRTQNCEAVTIFVSFSHFSFEISALNLQQESLSQAHLQILGKGSYGKIYLFKINDSNVAIKSIHYLNELSNIERTNANQKGKTDTISKAIFQYCLYKLFSVLKIGPKMKNVFGFDLLICKNKIEFSMQKCLNLHENLKSLESLFASLDLMHSLRIIHGDIKPDNIMWSPSFQKWVFIDFGFSQVLKEKPGQKTYTNYFGSYKNCSNEMKNIFHSSKSEFIDLYFNDLFGMKMVNDGFFSKLIEGPLLKLKQKKLASKQYANFIENCQLCYLFYNCKYDGFDDFLVELNHNFIPLQQFWSILSRIKNKSQQALLMFKKLSNIILGPQNMINNYTQQKCFEWRIQQKVDEFKFNGPIDDTMLFSLIYLNFDFSPNRYVQKQILFKSLMMKFEPSDLKCWKDFINFLKNPYVSFKQVVRVFEKIKKIMEIKDWISTEVKQYQLFLKGRQIGRQCLLKYGFNLFELSEGYHIYGQFVEPFVQFQKIRIFEYSKFSDLIELHSNQFPYLQFLKALQKNLIGQQLISDCLMNIQRIQQKYKFQEQPFAIKLFKDQLILEFSLKIKKQEKTSFKNLEIFNFLIDSRIYNLEVNRLSVFNFEKEIENVEKYEKQLLSKSFFDIFNMKKNVSTFFKERFNKLKQGINENDIENLIRNFFETFEIFFTSSENRDFHLLDNFLTFYYLFYKYFSKFQKAIINSNLAKFVNDVLENKISSPKFFIRICSILGKLEIESVKSKFERIKTLFEYFEQNQKSTLIKSIILYNKIYLNNHFSLYEVGEVEKALKMAVNFYLGLKSQKQKISLFSCIETIYIFKSYLSQSYDSKQEKQVILQQFLKLAYNQQGDFELLPVITQMVLQFYCDCQEMEFGRCMQIIMKCTYFMNRKGENSYEMLKYVIVDYALEQFICFSIRKNCKNVTKNVFSYICKVKNCEKEQFYRKNGNLIIVIEKYFKFTLNGCFFISVSEIIWLFKFSYRLIKHSNLAFSRSFYAAMDFWFPQIVHFSGLKIGQRKRKIIVNRCFRNPQFVRIHKDSQKALRIRKQISLSFQFKIVSKFKNKLDRLYRLKQLKMSQSFQQSKDKFFHYLEFLHKRERPDLEVVDYFKQVGEYVI